MASAILAARHSPSHHGQCLALRCLVASLSAAHLSALVTAEALASVSVMLVILAVGTARRFSLARRRTVVFLEGSHS